MEDHIELFKELYDKWFDKSNEKLWFNATLEDDIYLSNNYFISITDFAYNEELINETVQIQIGAIIAFDQIPRHYKRTVEDKFDEKPKMYSQLAADISVSLMTKLSQDIVLYNSVKAYEWCFILLPFRHLKDCDKMHTIVRFIIEKHNKPETPYEDLKIYKRFLINTLKQLHKQNTENAIQEQKNTYHIHLNRDNQWTKYASVLENYPTTQIIDIKDNNSKVIKHFLNNMKSISIANSNLIMSLSGGVDSCVCLYLLKQLYPFHNIIAVHINYANKDENEMELKFVRKYCAVLNVKLYYRTITEIHRDDCHHQGLRDIYESITKDIRFDMYKCVSELYQDEPSFILLGHNQDDCFENIITNISTCKHYDNLSGMSLSSKINQIQILRPLLDIRKIDIILFAIKMNIPFLKNSTPSWSNRGKIRDTILPALQNINTNIIDTFINLSKYSNEMNEITTQYVDNILQKHYIDNKFTFEKSRIPYNQILWISIFEKLFIQKHISHKSVTEFIKYLRRFENSNDTKCTKFELCKEIKVIGKICKDTIILLFQEK
jgi:tRNA(Ile)-lysidine synthetase-like protein